MAALAISACGGYIDLAQYTVGYITDLAQNIMGQIENYINQRPIYFIFSIIYPHLTALAALIF